MIVMRRCLIGLSLIIVSLCSFLIATPAVALVNPTSVTLPDTIVYRHLIQANDWFVSCPYDIEYASSPGIGIERLFTFSLLSTDGSTEIGSIVPYSYVNYGFPRGVTGFYIADSTNTTSGNLTWGSGYIVRVRENPSQYPSPINWDFPLSSSNYHNQTSQSANQGALLAQLLSWASKLDTDWSTTGIVLLTSSDQGTVLSSYGELYFRSAIQGLQNMCPTLFAVQTEPLTYEKRSWDYSLWTTFQTRWAGTFIADFMTGFAGLFSVTTSWATSMASVIIFAVIIIFSLRKMKGTTLSAFMDGFTILIMATLSGWFSFTICGLAAFIAAVTAGLILFLNRS